MPRPAKRGAHPASLPPAKKHRHNNADAHTRSANLAREFDAADADYEPRMVDSAARAHAARAGASDI